MVPFCFLFYSKLGPGTLGFLRLGSQFYSCNHCFSSPPSSSCARLCVRVRQDKYVLQDWVFSIEAANTPVWTPRGEVCQRASRSGFGGSTDVHPKPAQFWPACRHGLKAGGVEAAQRRHGERGRRRGGPVGGLLKARGQPLPRTNAPNRAPKAPPRRIGFWRRTERRKGTRKLGRRSGEPSHPSIHPPGGEGAAAAAWPASLAPCSDSRTAAVCWR